MRETNNSRRIAKNTALLYFRLLITMGVSLYTSRVVLESLGISDFGIYGVVGGVVTMLSFFTSSLSSSFQRFFCIELANNNISRLKELIGSAIIILSLISIIVIFISETFGLWFVRNKLVIPDDRIFQATIVFQFSLLTFIVSLFQSIFNALIISYERMNVFAYISIFDALTKVLVALSINLFSDNKLIYYSAFVFLSSFFSLLIYYWFCRRSYELSNIKLRFNKPIFFDVFKFSGWTLLGTFSNMLKNNGMNILLNIFYGPIINAARGISYQIYTAISSFTSSFQVAFTPQITKSYAHNDFEYLQKLILSSSKLSYYLMLVLSVPIFVDTNFILYLWLGNDIPSHTASFTQLVVLTGLIECLSPPIVNVLYANGRIRTFQIMISIIIMLVLPLSYFLLKQNYSPESALIVSLLLTILAHCVRLYFLKRCMPFKIFKYFKEIIIPIILFTTFILLVPICISNKYHSIGNYIFTIFVVELILILGIYICGLRIDERHFIINKFKSIFRCKN